MRVKEKITRLFRTVVLQLLIISISWVVTSFTIAATQQESTSFPWTTFMPAILEIKSVVSECYDVGEVTSYNDEKSCTNAGGFWFDFEWGCIANQGARDYVDNGDGTITDLVTRLMWQQHYGEITHYSEARDYCNNLVLGEGARSDWRLPTKDELKGLVVCTNGQPTPLDEYPSTRLNCDGTNVFVVSIPMEPRSYSIPTISPLFHTEPSFYWSSTSSKYSDYAGVDFNYGFMGWQSSFGYGYVRCVR